MTSISEPPRTVEFDGHDIISTPLPLESGHPLTQFQMEAWKPYQGRRDHSLVILRRSHPESTTLFIHCRSYPPLAPTFTEYIFDGSIVDHVRLYTGLLLAHTSSYQKRPQMIKLDSFPPSNLHPCSASLFIGAAASGMDNPRLYGLCPVSGAFVLRELDPWGVKIPPRVHSIQYLDWRG